MLVTLLISLRNHWCLVFLGALLVICPGFGKESSAHEPAIEADAKVKAASEQATSDYEQAAAAQNGHKFVEAAKLWNAFVEKHEDDPLVPRAQHYLGVCLLQGNDLNNAENAFTASLQGEVNDNDEFREDTYIDLGWVHFLRGAEGDASQMESAADLFWRYLTAFPEGKWVDEALFYRGEALITFGKTKEGVALHTRIVEDFPDSPLRVESLFAVGVGYYDLGDKEQAAKFMDEFLANHKDDQLFADVAFRRGQLLTQQREFDKAAELFRQSADNDGFESRDQALLHYGYCLSASGKHEAAAKGYASLIEECSNSPLVDQATYDVGRCLFNAKQYDEALVWLKQSVESPNPNRVLMSRHLISRSELANERFDEASVQAQLGLDWITENADATHRMRLPLSLDNAAAMAGIPDKQTAAMQTFLSLADEFPESPVAPRSLYRAIRLAISLNDATQAKSLSTRFVADYAEHELVAEVKKLSADLSLSNGEAATAESELKELLVDSKENDRNDDSTKNEATATPEASTTTVPSTDPDPSQSPSLPPLTLPTAPKIDSPSKAPSQPLLPDSLFQNNAGSKNGWTAPTAPTADSTAPAGNANAETHALNRFDDPTKPLTQEEIQRKLGQSFFLQKKYKECLRVLAPLINENERTLAQAQVLYLFGTSHFHLGDFEIAAKSLSNALLINPKSSHAPQICVRLSQALVKTNRIEEAKRVLGQVVRVFPNSELREQSLLQLAELEYASGNNTDGLVRYKQLLNEYPASKWANRAAFGVARIAAKKKEEDRALKLLERLLVRSSDPALKREVLLLHAATLQKKGQHQSCLQDLESLITQNPSGDLRSNAMLLAAPSHIATSHPGLARQCLESIVKDNPAYGRMDQVLYQLAWLAKQQGDEQNAVSHFGKLVATIPQSPLAAEANFHLGEDAFKRRRAKEALPYFESAAKNSTNEELSEKAMHRMAWCFYSQRLFSDAEVIFAKQLETFPKGRTSKVAKFLIGECMFMQSNYAAAFEQYKLVADGEGLSAKQEALTYLHGGQAAAKLNQWKLAERWLIQIHTKFGDSEYAAVAYWELAQILRAQKRMDEAATAMRHAARAGRGLLSAKAQFELAEIAHASGKPGQAYREFQVLMYGFGGKLANKDLRDWQVKAALRAADCAAEKAKDAFRSDEEKYVRQAEKCLNFVIEQSPGTNDAETAAKRLANLVDQFDVEPLRR